MSLHAQSNKYWLSSLKFSNKTSLKQSNNSFLIKNHQQDLHCSMSDKYLHLNTQSQMTPDFYKLKSKQQNLNCS